MPVLASWLPSGLVLAVTEAAAPTMVFYLSTSWSVQEATGLLAEWLAWCPLLALPIGP